ncbi:TetR/AcrR family transcriptional regulator [Curtobacterium sp. MCBD17_028]|uniref:TetR/AcrR family transcriptional regulator n=1 Tax=Curtobacterium sp. MCBD17_028 TaxID=2175670 RepID=UPI000DA88674|nr:helix-turn-helix domain-containing protein [Curtobacterium sp. MCBD17_028]PZE25634.1 TetR/AcrR family transcriptional regulator [Curtobacterium sp. MCBD17_028]
MPHILRTDAQDNRDRALDAARALFAERGLAVTMREVARRADIGPATLYRRFPTKQALMDAAFADELRACRAAVEDGAAHPDPWHGFCSMVVALAVLNARNRGFTEAMTAAHPSGEALHTHRTALLRIIADLVRRAQLVGALRIDVGVDDVVLVLIAGRAAPSVATADREAVARRSATLVLDAFRASRSNASLPPAPPAIVVPRR